MPGSWSDSFVFIIHVVLQETKHDVTVRFFQLPLSLRDLILNGSSMGWGFLCVFSPFCVLRLLANFLIWIFATALSASVQRSLFMLATSMLLFAAKIYQITELAAFLKLSIPDVSLCYYSLIRYPTNILSEACITYVLENVNYV